jgi:hypothetical protein
MSPLPIHFHGMMLNQLRKVITLLLPIWTHKYERNFSALRMASQLLRFLGNKNLAKTAILTCRAATGPSRM